MTRPYSLAFKQKNGRAFDWQGAGDSVPAVTGASNFQAGYFPIAVLPEGRTFGVTFRYKF